VRCRPRTAPPTSNEPSPRQAIAAATTPDAVSAPVRGSACGVCAGAVVGQYCPLNVSVTGQHRGRAPARAAWALPRQDCREWLAPRPERQGRSSCSRQPAREQGGRAYAALANSAASSHKRSSRGVIGALDTPLGPRIHAQDYVWMIVLFEVPTWDTITPG
jgi:hypothetical protein